MISEATLCAEDGGADEWAPITDCAAFAAGRHARRAAELDRADEGNEETRSGSGSSFSSLPSVRTGPGPDKITGLGEDWVLGSKVCLGLAGIILAICLIAWVGLGAIPVAGLFAAGACLGLALWLYLIGQVVLIRAAVERLKDKG